MKKETLPFLSVVIPAFDSKNFFKHCLESLLKMNYPQFEIIVVDDGSTDGSYEAMIKISKQHPQLRIIKTLRRRGIPGSRNLGIEVAKGDYIAFLDMDMDIESRWPRDLITIFMKNKTVGAIVPKVLDFNQRDIIQACGIYIIPHTAWVIPRGFGQKDVNQYSKVEEIGLGAAGSIVRKKILEEIGGFDEDLGPFDDIDMGWRIRLAGWKTLYLPSAVIHHWTAKPWTVRPKSSRRIEHEYYLDNLIRLPLKNLELKNVLRLLPVGLLIMFGRVLYNLVKGNLIPLFGGFKAFLAILHDFPQILKQRSVVQVKRKVKDKELQGNFFLNESIIKILFYQLKPTLDTSIKWTEDLQKTKKPEKV